MKNAKCTSCGATIQVDETTESGICPYCNSAYVTEKAISMFSNTTTNNASVINNYYTQQSATPSQVVEVIEPRPKINWGLAILGFLFYIFPGVIYVCSKVAQQKEWDEKVKKRKI